MLSTQVSVLLFGTQCRLLWIALMTYKKSELIAIVSEIPSGLKLSHTLE